MASLTRSSVNLRVSAQRSSPNAKAFMAISIRVGDDTIYISREEAAQLAADLLNAAEATPVGMTERAA